MNRNIRVAVTLSVGLFSIVTGLGLQVWSNDVIIWLIQLDRSGRWPGLFHAVAETARWMGFILVGIAVHAWITAPRD